MPDQDFIDECEALILGHSGPFTSMSEAASSGLADYLRRKPTGSEKTRIEMFTGDRSAASRKEFFWTLGFVGAFASRHGLERIQEHSNLGARPSLDLELGDIQFGEKIVSAKGTAACPDEPPP